MRLIDSLPLKWRSAVEVEGGRVDALAVSNDAFDSLPEVRSRFDILRAIMTSGRPLSGVSIHSHRFRETIVFWPRVDVSIGPYRLRASHPMMPYGVICRTKLDGMPKRDWTDGNEAEYYIGIGPPLVPKLFTIGIIASLTAVSIIGSLIAIPFAILVNREALGYLASLPLLWIFLRLFSWSLSEIICPAQDALYEEISEHIPGDLRHILHREGFLSSPFSCL